MQGSYDFRKMIHCYFELWSCKKRPSNKFITGIANFLDDTCKDASIRIFTIILCFLKFHQIWFLAPKPLWAWMHDCGCLQNIWARLLGSWVHARMLGRSYSKSLSQLCMLALICTPCAKHYGGLQQHVLWIMILNVTITPRMRPYIF